MLKQYAKLLILVVMVCLFASVAQADSGVTTNTSQETRSDLGPSYSDSVVGKNGYKVFQPGAIKTQSVGGTKATRRGSSDAWLTPVFSWDWKQIGWAHRLGVTSSSDLWEGSIWADGYLKVRTDKSWRTTCSTHTSGDYAYCLAQFNEILPYYINGSGKHFFSKSGYQDQNLATSDSA